MLGPVSVRVHFCRRCIRPPGRHHAESDGGSPGFVTMNILIALSHLFYLSVMSEDTNELFSGPNENRNG